MQRACQATSARRVPEEQLVLCCGVGFGKLLKIGDDDVFGHEVNIASKLGEDIAKAHEILITRACRDAVGELSNVTWEEARTEHAGADVCWRVGYAR
jgi:adenylate cyclase